MIELLDDVAFVIDDPSEDDDDSDENKDVLKEHEVVLEFSGFGAVDLRTEGEDRLTI
jgi:hypothetical protein